MFEEELLLVHISLSEVVPPSQKIDVSQSAEIERGDKDAMIDQPLFPLVTILGHES